MLIGVKKRLLLIGLMVVVVAIGALSNAKLFHQRMLQAPSSNLKGHPIQQSGWPHEVNDQFSYTIQYPPGWQVRATAPNSVEFSNQPFSNYAEGGIIPSGGAEILVAIIKQDPGVTLSRLDGLYAAYEGEAKTVALANGFAALEIEPDRESGRTPGKDIFYYIHVGGYFYRIGLISSDVSNDKQLRTLFDESVNSFGLISN